jgi:methionyl-tRNA synthetase
MIHRFRQGTIKSIGLMALPESEVRCHLQTWSDDELKVGQTFYRDKFSDFHPSNALRAPLARALACNALVETSAPWNLSKDKQQEKLLDAVLYHLAESLRIIAILISPVTAACSEWHFRSTELENRIERKRRTVSLKDAEWGRLLDGHVVGKPHPLFPRIEEEFLGSTPAARVAESVITIASFSRRKGRQLTLRRAAVVLDLRC